MVLIFDPNIEKFEKGITLIEIIVVIFIVAAFSMILIADFPKIQRQFALSDTAYKMEQDLRTAQDDSLSGVQIKDAVGAPITKIRGYGIYMDLTSLPPEKYILYADVADATGNSDYKFNDALPHNCPDSEPYNCCSQDTAPAADCVIDVFDITKENPNLEINSVTDSSGNPVSGGISINFNPPNPTTTIKDNNSTPYDGIIINLGLSTDSTVRKVSINTSGLISVK